MPFPRNSLLRLFQIKSFGYPEGSAHIMRRSGRLAAKGAATETRVAPIARTTMKTTGKVFTASSVPNCLPAYTGLLSYQLKMKKTLIHHLRLQENAKPKCLRWTIQSSSNETKIVHGKLEHMYRAQVV